MLPFISAPTTSIVVGLVVVGVCVFLVVGVVVADPLPQADSIIVIIKIPENIIRDIKFISLLNSMVFSATGYSDIDLIYSPR